MKRIVLVLLVQLAVSSLTFAQSKGAVIRFEKTEHDYGTIQQNGDGNCEFRFSNTGDEPLILSSVRSSCGCTIPKWPKEPVLPGQSASIFVTYDTKRIGTISKQITVLSNAGEGAVTLSIKGNVVQKPSEVMPFKTVNQDLSPNNN